MGDTSELACVYASLILQDEGIDLSATNINKLIKAAEVNVEPIWPTLFAKNISPSSIETLLSNVGSGTSFASGPASGAAAPVSESAPVEKGEDKSAKKEEPEEESDDDMGFGLFD